MYSLDPTKTALIIVDVQVDFCSPEGKSAKYGGQLEHMEKTIPKIEAFHQKMNEKGVLSIFTRYITKKNGIPANIELLLSESKLFPICLEGEQGAGLYRIRPNKKDLVIDKLYYDAFAGTTLLKKLKTSDIQNVLVTGVWTDVCVDTTAKRAFAEGFNAIIVKDLVSTIDERIDRHEQVLEDFDKHFGYMKSSDEVLKLLEQN